MIQLLAQPFLFFTDKNALFNENFMSLWLIHTKRDRKRFGTWTRTETMEFSRNEFHWIPWIVAKSKNGMVTRSINYLASTTFPIIVIERTFFLDRYLFPLTTPNRYLHSCSDIKFIFLLLLLRMYLSPDLGYPWLSLDFVTIHWIQQKPFRENSIGYQSLSPPWTSMNVTTNDCTVNER